MSTNESQVFRCVIKSGAIYGLTFGALAEISLRLIYTLERHTQEAASFPPDVHIQMTSYPFQWWYVPLLSFTLLLPARVLTCRYLSRYITPPIWRWQATGFVGVFVFYLLTLISDLWNARLSIMGADYWQFAGSMNPGLWVALTLGISAYSFAYGSIRKYLRKRLVARDAPRSQNDPFQWYA